MGGGTPSQNQEEGRKQVRWGRNDLCQELEELEAWKDHGRMKPSPPEPAGMQPQTEFLFLLRAMVPFNPHLSNVSSLQMISDLCSFPYMHLGQTQVPACWCEGPI